MIIEEGLDGPRYPCDVLSEDTMSVDTEHEPTRVWFTSRDEDNHELIEIGLTRPYVEALVAQLQEWLNRAPAQ
jgi:hypothetical protein